MAKRKKSDVRPRRLRLSAESGHYRFDRSGSDDSEGYREAVAFLRSFTIDGLIDRIEANAANELSAFPREIWGWPHKLPERPTRLRIAALAVQRAWSLRRRLADLTEGRTPEEVKQLRQCLETAVKLGASFRDVGMAARNDKRDSAKSVKTAARHDRWIQRARIIRNANHRKSVKQIAQDIANDEKRRGISDARSAKSVEKVIRESLEK